MVEKTLKKKIEGLEGEKNTQRYKDRNGQGSYQKSGKQEKEVKDLKC